jgi:hypothetical protein
MKIRGKFLSRPTCWLLPPPLLKLPLLQPLPPGSHAQRSQKTGAESPEKRQVAPLGTSIVPQMVAHDPAPWRPRSTHPSLRSSPAPPAE